MSGGQALGASFRDPSGFVFEHEGRIHRQVNQCYAADYDLLCSSGLYQKLSEARLLIPHEEVRGPLVPSQAALHYKTLRPEQLDFVSYPYEWCFSQLKDAALLTLRIQRIALAAGMSLKDASVYNVQFQRGRPVFIDTLSFEKREEGEPWVGYRQLCQHFLAPLALMALRDVRLSNLLKVHLDGIPLDLATSLLPLRAWRRAGLWMHLRLHAASQRRYEKSGADGALKPAPRLTTQALANLVASLEAAIKQLSWKPQGTEWADYYEGDSYAAAALDSKQALVKRHLEAIQPKTVWDLGANTGLYSRLASETAQHVVAFDVDPACVERAYLQQRRRLRQKQQGEVIKEEKLLPLVVDLTNPSPGIGWANEERTPIGTRGRPDCILALALIHHLAISNNVPLEKVATHFSNLASDLVIEFVPKTDPKVKTLLATRKDVFPGYTQEGFEAAFESVFEILDRTAIEGSDRTLYRMKSRMKSEMKQGR